MIQTYVLNRLYFPEQKSLSFIMPRNPPNSPRLCKQMQIFSRGSFYFGRDSESFFDISIHLGNFRLEWGEVHKGLKNESSKEATDR